MQVPAITMAPGGPSVSRIALGVWRLAQWGLNSAGIVALVEQSLELGITTIDHADIYGGYACEELFGDALAGRPELRERMQIVTKCGIKLVTPRRPSHGIKSYDTSRSHIIASAENSLRLLRSDRIDLLLIHRPDPLLDADEVAGAFEELRQAGKVLHFGVSNFTSAQFELLAARVPLVTNQIEISPLHLDAWADGTLDQAQRLRLAPMAWSPLAGGALFKADTPQAQRVRAALQEVGAELNGASADQVALAWLLAHPARIVPVLGTGSAERAAAAAGAAALTLSREQWFRVWTASTGREVP